MGLKRGAKYFWAATLLLFFPLHLALSFFDPVRTVSGLWQPRPEPMARVTTSRVVIADYFLIKRDFIQTRTMSNDEIDKWLIKETSFISKAQANQTEANDKITVSSEERFGQRPLEYRRGIVFEVENGLLDAKGTGALEPKRASHETGLVSLGELIREFCYEKLVHLLFKATGSKFTTVGTYAVVDFGFDVKLENNKQARAGYVLRQASNRQLPGVESLSFGEKFRNWGIAAPMDIAIGVETLLRRFGITSAGANREKFDYDLINIQATKEGAVIDFGAFLRMARFDRAVQATNRYPGNHSIVWQTEIVPQADPNLEVPWDKWGSKGPGEATLLTDYPTVEAHRLAEEFAKNRVNKSAIESFYHSLLDPVAARLKANLKPCAATELRLSLDLEK